MGDETNERLVESILRDEPWLFTSERADFEDWRVAVVRTADVSPTSVYVVGSAAVGFSLNPNKVGRSFKGPTEADPSDVDVAIVDHDLFMTVWEECVAVERKRAYRFATQDREGIYWGHASQWRLWRRSNAAGLMRTMVANAQRKNPVRGHQVTVRLYRRREDLRHYQMLSLVKLRQKV